MSGAHSVENTNTEKNTNISRTTACRGGRGAAPRDRGC